MIETSDYLRSPTCWFLFFGSLIVTAFLTPLVARLARRLGAVDRGGYRKVYEGSMPLLGGLGIAFPIVVICLLGLSDITGMFALVEPVRPQFLVLALGSLMIVGLGVYDDTRGLRARYKLVFQILIALFVVLAGDVLTVVRLPLLGTVQITTGIAVFLGVGWIVGLINAINVIDGIDGLATGISLIAAIGLLTFAAIGQYTFVVLVCAALAGSLLGFLPYNFHPAKIFLGDTGSMFLGFVLASVTLMGTYKSETALIVLAPLLALGFPIFETLLSMTRRLVRGAPMFTGDDLHTHHRLLSRGYSQRKVVFLLYGVSAVLTTVAIIGRMVPEEARWDLISLGVGGATLIGLGWLAGYLRVAPANSFLQRRERNTLLNAYARYAALSLSANGRRNAEELLGLGCRELGLRRLSVRRGDELLQIDVDEGVPPAGQSHALRLKVADDQDLVIEYVLARDLDDEDKRDVAACLARVFEEGVFPGSGIIDDKSKFQSN